MIPDDSLPKLPQQESLQELAALVGNLAQAHKSLAILMASDTEELTKREREAKSLQAQWEAADTLRRDQETKVRREKVQHIKLGKELAEARRRLDIALAEANRAKALREKAAKFDLDTGKARWRVGHEAKIAKSHQISGGKFLAAVSKAVCADKRGLGKSLTAIIAADMVKAKRILVVCPYDVVTNFYEEFAFWSPRPYLFKLSDMPRNVREAMLPMLHDQEGVVVFTNYESLYDKSTLEHLKAIRFDTIIADEAHNMKESGSLAFKAMRQLVYDVNICPQCTTGRYFVSDEKPRNPTWLCKSCGYMFQPVQIDPEEVASYRTVERVWPMTGTPILNRPQELWTLLYLIAKDLFPSERVFLDLYCVKTGPSSWKFTPGGEKALMERISQFFLKRTPEMAGVEFPAQTETFYELELKESEYPQQYSFYKKLRDRAALELSEGKVVGIISAIALLTRLRQAIVYPYGIEIKDPDTGDVVDRCPVSESVKMDWTENMVQTIMDEDETNACIVFSQFKPGLRELARRLNKSGIRAIVLDGDTSKEMRDRVKHDFALKHTHYESPNRRWDVVLANYKVGGAGLNLNRANHTVILDEEWNPGMIDQAYGRTQRLDSVRPSYVHVPQVKGTVDSKMRRLILSKANMIQGFDTEAENRSAIEELISDILNPD